MNSLLRHRVHELSDDGLSLDQLVGSLRTTFPKYGRYKLQPFTKMVKQIIDSSNSKGKQKSTSNDDDKCRSMFNDDDSGPLSKKAKKIDRGEQRLKMLERNHVASRTIELQSESESSESHKSAVLDEVYGLQFEPEFDLTKSMLRNKYRGSKVDINVGLEMVTNSSNNKETIKTVKPDNLSNDDGRKDNGPRFKDLGGINIVLHELKMKVLFSLFRPNLPRYLGVRPSAGILLHGPPGCGKTTLAHAIANETGLPLYKLSATELVSGISVID